MRLRMFSAGLLTTALGLAAGAVAPVGAATGEADWGPVRNLSALAPATYSPTVVLGRRGVATAAWVRGESPRSIASSVRRRDGDWTRERKVPGTRGATEAVLGIADDGTRLLTWATPHAVKAAHRSPGERWSDAVVVHRTRGPRWYVADLQLSVNGAGQAVAAWQIIYIGPPGGDTDTRIQAALGAAEGWTAARTLSDRTEPSGSPAATVDGSGRATVAWNEKVDGRWSVMTSSRRPGTRWGMPKAIDQGPPQPGSPELAANASGDIAVAWAEGAGETVRVVRWSRGAGWGAVAEVPGIRSFVWWVDLGIDAQGTATVTWTNRGAQVWAADQTVDGRWTRQRVADAGSVNEPPVLVVAPSGDALVGWPSRARGDHPIEAAHRPAGGGWGATVLLSGVPGDAFGPALALGASGDGVAVWANMRDIRVPGRVQARYLDAS